MKNVFLVLLFAISLCPSITIAQDAGIKFENGLTWNEIKAKAKAENKYIFMDCYTTWCGPCKAMVKYIFPLKEVGDYFNDHFINVSVQMDETAKDPDEIKKWYGDAKEIETIYSIAAYPTYLFFSPDGKPLHRFVGGAKDGSEFISKAKDAFETDKQYYSLIENYKQHLNDSLFLRKAMSTSLASQDNGYFSLIATAYLNCIKDPYGHSNIWVMEKMISSTNDNNFKTFMDNADKIDQANKPGYAEGFARRIIYSEEFKKITDDNKVPEWKRLQQRLKISYRDLKMINYEDLAEQTAYELKIDYYAAKQQWSEYSKAVEYLMDKYGKQIGSYNGNSFAWGVFLYCVDKKILEKALKWSENILLDAKVQPACIDTYANLLYKLGKKDDAIVWEQKAIQSAIDPKYSSDQKDFAITLEKMKKGEKTWRNP